MSSRYGRSVTRVPAQAGVNRFRRYPLVGPLFSPWWLAVVLVIVMGAGVTATAFTLSSSSTSASTSGTPPSAVPSGVPPSALSANPGGASAGHGAFNDVSCDSGTQCVAVGADSSGVGVVATSTNDGSSFTSVVLPSGTPALSSVSCVEPGTCVAVGGDDILHSGDNGSTWNAQQISQFGSGTFETFHGASCQSAALCLVVGIVTLSSPALNQGIIMVSNDGGSTWALDKLPGPISGISSVACATPARCIAVGSNVLVSSDGGVTWVLTPVNGGSGQLFSIACPSTTECVAVGPNAAGALNPADPGNAIISTDGGNTFSAVTLPASTVAVYEVSCSSSTSCTAAGATGTGMSAPVFISTSNGGANWSDAVPPPNFTAISGLSCIASSCVAVGSTGSGSSVASSTASLSPSGQWNTASAPASQPAT